MTNRAGIAIEECAAPGGVDPASPAAVGACDGNTHQSSTVTASTTKGITATGYSVYALPDPNLAELSGGNPQCDLTHLCVLYIGQNQNSASAPHIYSQPFYVDPVTAPTVAPTRATGFPRSPWLSACLSLLPDSSGDRSSTAAAARIGPTPPESYSPAAHARQRYVVGREFRLEVRP